jgi:sRNA-binding protein
MPTHRVELDGSASGAIAPKANQGDRRATLETSANRRAVRRDRSRQAAEYARSAERRALAAELGVAFDELS